MSHLSMTFFRKYFWVLKDDHTFVSLFRNKPCLGLVCFLFPRGKVVTCNETWKRRVGVGWGVVTEGVTLLRFQIFGWAAMFFEMVSCKSIQWSHRIFIYHLIKSPNCGMLKLLFHSSNKNALCYNLFVLLYRTPIRPVMLYGIEYWSTKKQSVNKMSVIETRMLRYICDKTRRERELEMKTFVK